MEELEDSVDGEINADVPSVTRDGAKALMNVLRAAPTPHGMWALPAGSCFVFDNSLCMLRRFAIAWKCG